MNPFFFPRLGGIERRVYHLSRALAARGHDVTVLTARLPGTAAEESMDGVRVVRLPATVVPLRWNPPLLVTRGVGAALRDLAPDVVDYHYRWAPETTRAVARADAPVVHTWHNAYGEGSGILRPLSLANDRWHRRYAERAAAVACISEAVRDDLARRGFPPAKLHVVPNGCAPAAPGTAEWEPDDARAAPAAPYVVAVGRLTPEKGTDDAVRALAAAVARGADLRLLVCGEGPERARLDRLARRLGVAQRVDVAGWVPEGAKLRLLRGALALLHMARFESFGIAVAEAVVVGVPVVATRVGGVPEVVGDAGELVAPGDADAAGAALARLVAEPARRERLAGLAAERAKGFAWSDVARRMETVYRGAVETAS